MNDTLPITIRFMRGLKPLEDGEPWAALSDDDAS
jgi:hypothetical protein